MTRQIVQVVWQPPVGLDGLPILFLTRKETARVLRMGLETFDALLKDKLHAATIHLDAGRDERPNGHYYLFQKVADASAVLPAHPLGLPTLAERRGAARRRRSA